MHFYFCNIDCVCVCVCVYHELKNEFKSVVYPRHVPRHVYRACTIKYTHLKNCISKTSIQTMQTYPCMVHSALFFSHTHFILCDCLFVCLLVCNSNLFSFIISLVRVINVIIVIVIVVVCFGVSTNEQNKIKQVYQISI